MQNQLLVECVMFPFAGSAAYFCDTLKSITPLDPEHNPLHIKYYFTAISFPNI
jgi:hypothetical protein